MWAFYGICTYGALYTGLLLSLGMTQSQIGWIMALPMFTLPMQIVGAVLQQRYFNRKKFWVTALSSYLLMFGLMGVLVVFWPTLPPGLRLSAFVIILILANIGFQLHRPVALAWQTEIIPERESSVFWNRMTSQGTVAAVVAGFLMGWVADHLGRDNRMTFVWILAVGMVFAVSCTRVNMRVPDPDPDPRPEEGALKSILLVIRNSNFRRLSAVFSLHSIGNWLCCAFIFVHLQKTMGFSMVEMQILMGLSCAVSLVAGRLFGIVGKHYGRKPVLLICTLIKSVEFLLWGTMRPGDHAFDLIVRNATTTVLGDWASLPAGLASAVPVFLLGGFVNVGIASMQLAFMRNMGPRQNQTLAISLFFSLSGVIGGVVAGLSGWFFKLLDTPGFGPDFLREQAIGFGLTPFNILALGGAAVYVVCAISIRALHEDGAAPTLHVVRVLLANNPFRGAMHAQALSTPLPEARRMDVLSHARGGLVEGELVHDLYSSSSQVRDGAMRNIASMGVEMDHLTAEELIKVLEMPELGMQVDAAKALGRGRYKPALPYLVALFDNDDTTLACAALYAAGLIGDPSVLPEIRRILSENGLPVEKAAAAEAISRMSDPIDARLVFEAFAQNTNPLLRTQCLVSLCRCMHDRQQVYQVFEDEARKPGAQIVGLFNSIAQRWQGLDLDTMIARLDSARYHEIATSVISPVLEFCIPCTRPPEVSESDFLKSHFADNGRFKDAMLEDSDYVATSLWLQLRLWPYLEYGTEGQDRFVLLTILFLCDHLSKRLDPRHPRTRSVPTPEG